MMDVIAYMLGLNLIHVRKMSHYYPAFTAELYGVYCEDFEEKWP